MKMSREKRNYEHLVDQAEQAFSKGTFLEAFLIQSYVIEGVLKNYALVKLASIINQSSVLKQKYKNFEFSRLIDELFVTGKIEKDLYENLSKYKKKRNKIVHHILKYDDNTKLNKELKEAYKLGKDMKGFIVDDMMKSRRGKTTAELRAKLVSSLSELELELPSAMARELLPEFKKINDLLKL